MLLPMTAIHTTDTAEGTRTMYSEKCCDASRKPNAELFMAVSMAVVRAVVSSKPSRLTSWKPIAPPSRWSKATATCSSRPALMMGSTHCATDAPTSRTVAATPMTGQMGSTARQNFGTVALSVTPSAIGASTTWRVDMAMPMASTATMAPSTTLAMRGVMNTQPIVVEVVMSTDMATSPLAMYVHRFDACPPLMEPTSTRPATSAGLRPAALPRSMPRSGMIT
mmetsp:Transcript_534/g.2031  ORF Transcript_534/g.2031 Transcript_534/m.2031 type:complete len:223 (+) Transcript_534:237-905(+)